MARQIVIFAVICIFPLLVYSQEQRNEKPLTETQVYLNLDDFEIIHLSSGIQGETIPQIIQEKQPEPRRISDVSRQQREEIMRRAQEIRTAMRKIEDDTSQKNPELKAITDKINDLQQQRKARLDEILANNQEYQTLKEKISNQNFQGSEAMQMSMIERRAASQDEQIKQIDQQVRELTQQKQLLLQTVLQDNQEYQSQAAESQSIMQSFRADFQRPGSTSTGQSSSSTTGGMQPSSSTDTGSRRGRNTDTGTNIPGNPPSANQPNRGFNRNR